MKKILAGIMALSMSLCMFSCGDSEEENITENSAVSSGETSSEESVSPDVFASIGYSKANEIVVILDNEGMELPYNCIYSNDTLKNFNISDEFYERLGSEIEKYTEMKTDYDYFFVIQNYMCTCFVCTDGTNIGIMNTSGIAADGNYDEIYQAVYNEISLQ